MPKSDSEGRGNPAPGIPQVAKRVRLTVWQIQAIRDAVREISGEKARVFIFGSRTDLSKKGGDIDILVVSPGVSAKERFEIKKSIMVNLYRRFGERKIDLLVVDKPKTLLSRWLLRLGLKYDQKRRPSAVQGLLGVKSQHPSS